MDLPVLNHWGRGSCDKNAEDAADGDAPGLLTDGAATAPA